MTPTIEKHEDVLYAAKALYKKRPDWVTFYREVLGLHGIIRRHYPTLDSQAEFEQTEAYQRIHRMLTELRRRGTASACPEEEPIRVITVRIPKSMHDALIIEAHDRRTSMNKLCISKLLQFIAEDMVPGMPYSVPGEP